MLKLDTLRKKKNFFCVEVQTDTDCVLEAWLQPNLPPALWGTMTGVFYALLW